MVARNRCLNYLKREQINQAYVDEGEPGIRRIFSRRGYRARNLYVGPESHRGLPPPDEPSSKYAMEGLKIHGLPVRWELPRTVHFEKQLIVKLREQS